MEHASVPVRFVGGPLDGSVIPVPRVALDPRFRMLCRDGSWAWYRSNFDHWPTDVSADYDGPA